MNAWKRPRLMHQPFALLTRLPGEYFQPIVSCLSSQAISTLQLVCRRLHREIRARRHHLWEEFSSSAATMHPDMLKDSSMVQLGLDAPLAFQGMRLRQLKLYVTSAEIMVAMRVPVTRLSLVYLGVSFDRSHVFRQLPKVNTVCQVLVLRNCDPADIPPDESPPDMPALRCIKARSSTQRVVSLLNNPQNQLIHDLSLDWEEDDDTQSLYLLDLSKLHTFRLELDEPKLLPLDFWSGRGLTTALQILELVSSTVMPQLDHKLQQLILHAPPAPDWVAHTQHLILRDMSLSEMGTNHHLTFHTLELSASSEALPISDVFKRYPSLRELRQAHTHREYRWTDISSVQHSRFLRGSVRFSPTAGLWGQGFLELGTIPEMMAITHKGCTAEERAKLKTEMVKLELRAAGLLVRTTDLDALREGRIHDFMPTHLLFCDDDWDYSQEGVSFLKKDYLEPFCQRPLWSVREVILTIPFDETVVDRCHRGFPNLCVIRVLSATAQERALMEQYQQAAEPLRSLSGQEPLVFEAESVSSAVWEVLVPPHRKGRRKLSCRRE